MLHSVCCMYMSISLKTSSVLACGCECAIKGVASTARLPFVTRPLSRAAVLRIVSRCSYQISKSPIMLLCRVVLALLLLVLLHYCQAEEEPPPVPALPPVPLAETLAMAAGSESGSARAISSDAYIARNQRQCFETRSLVSCIKYKASKLIWKLATNSLGFFPNEYGRDRGRWLRMVQLGEPANEVVVFNDAKSLEGDSELTLMLKFLKRALETFGRNHGLQLSLSSESGARVMDESEARLKRKKKKWLIILPLVILMKIAHLKMTLVSMLLAVMGMNVLLVGGVGWLIHYLKYKTMCKIHPHLVQTHSHVYDSDPGDYSQFVGSSSYSNSYTPYSSGSGAPHELGGSSYSKDWATSKAYNGYNYLDTISKRIQ